MTRPTLDGPAPSQSKVHKLPKTRSTVTVSTPYVSVSTKSLPTPTYRSSVATPSRHSPPVGNPRPQSARPFLRGLRDIISPLHGLDLGNVDTGDYGPRVHPITKRYSFHTGFDLNGTMGQPVYAPANAVLARERTGDSIYGNQLVLAHGPDVETMYGHLSGFAEGLKPGDKIRQGELIGYVGSTGLSTGSHLHWETWRDNKPVNPITFIGGN